MVSLLTLSGVDLDSSLSHQVTFWWDDDDDVRFVLDKHAELDFYSVDHTETSPWVDSLAMI
jgi:hypothetical protein